MISSTGAIVRKIGFSFDPSTALKPRSGSILSMPYAGAQVSRRIDSEIPFPYITTYMKDCSSGVLE